MSLRPEVDLSDKNNWCVENSSLIAEMLGFEDSQLFRDCLTVYILEIVLDANIPDFLVILAHNHFISNGCLLKHK
jgi:hypothetical protein